MTDTYDKCRNDLEFRSKMAEKVGLGFEIPGSKSGDLYQCTKNADFDYAGKVLELNEKMARPERFELPTFWFVARRSIQLS